MSDYTELVAEARRVARRIRLDSNPHPAELLVQLTDALVAAEAATVEARRIAEGYRNAGHASRFDRLPWESPTEGGN